MNRSTAATLALLAALVPASASATPFKDIYQQVAGNTYCSSTTLCVMSFPKLPTGRHLEVEHLSCELVADKTRSHQDLRVRFAGGVRGDSIYQPLVLTTQDAFKRYWVVDGNAGFVVPPGEFFEIVYGASGAGLTWGHCVVSGVLVTDP